MTWQAMELGASIIWDKNLHMVNAAKRMNLTSKLPSESGDGFTIWNGQRFVLNQVRRLLSTYDALVS